MSNKIIYLGLTADLIHAGHINIINEALKYGQLLIGLITDQAISKEKRLPLLSYFDRKALLLNIKGVKDIVPQEDWDYSINLQKYKPDFFIHGDDWNTSEYKIIKNNCINVLSAYGGKLIEIAHTPNINSDLVVDKIRKLKNVSSLRQNTLKRLLQSKSFIKIIEVHSPMSAMIIDNLKINNERGSNFFDGFWSSSLSDSTLFGRPDIESLDIASRLNMINNIFHATTKPLVMDIDTGGLLEHLEINIKTIEQAGVSAVVIEDKKGLKKNSLFGNEVIQHQEDVKVFQEKIKLINTIKVNDNFLCIARIESLILDKGLEDALHRASSYVDAGADMVLIHSRKKTPDEVFLFANEFKRDHPNIPLACIPTSFYTVTEGLLQDKGFNLSIYANHLIRASYKHMEKIAKSILTYQTSQYIEEDIESVKDILNLIPGTK